MLPAYLYIVWLLNNEGVSLVMVVYLGTGRYIHSIHACSSMELVEYTSGQ